MSEYIRGYSDGRKDQIEIEKLKAQLELAEKVCEFTLKLWNMDELYLTSADKGALDAWRRAKEGK